MHKRLRSSISCSLKGLIKRITQFNGASNAYKWGSTMIQGKRRVDDITSCAAVRPKPTCCLQGLQMCDDCSFGEPCNSQNTMTIQKNLVPTGRTYSNNNIIHTLQRWFFTSQWSQFYSLYRVLLLLQLKNPNLVLFRTIFLASALMLLEEQMKFYIRSH